MDQFTATHALKDHAIFLDCRSLQARPIPLLLEEYQFVICDSRVRHSLASSEYNQRRIECERSVEILNALVPGIRSLRDVPFSDFERHLSVLPEPMRRRSRHVITENERTLRAAEALAAGRVREIGRLLSASHKSLRDDYAVSCPELDMLMETAEAQPGVLGARMTGPGFGGCTVNPVARSRIDAFCEIAVRDYRAKTGIMPEVFSSAPCDGARQIRSSHEPLV